MCVKIVRIIVLLTLAMWCTAVVAGAETEKSPVPQQITLSTEKYDTAVTAAETACDKALLIANQVYLKDLNIQLGVATKNKDTDAADAISLRKKNVEAEIAEIQERLTGPRYVVIVSKLKVSAKESWQKAVTVKKGDTLRITATGTWCMAGNDAKHWTCGPDGNDEKSLAGSAIGTLMGRVSSSVFAVGKGTEWTAPQDGVLELQANDTRLDDNVGSLVVTISAKQK